MTKTANSLSRFFSVCSIALMSAPLGQAQETKRPPNLQKEIATLQLQLRQSNDRSEQGVRLLLKLADLADASAKPYTFIRAATRFVVSNPDHKRQAELMLKLIDAQLITARDGDAISTARQFVSRHPNNTEVAGVHRMLAELFKRDQKFGAAAVELVKAYESSSGRFGHAADAVMLYRRQGSHRSFAEAARLAARLLSEDSNAPTKEEAAWLAIDSAKRSANQSVIIETGVSIADANTPLAGVRLVQYHDILAGAYWGLKQGDPARRHSAEAVKLAPAYPRFKSYFEIAHAGKLSATEMRAVFDLFKTQSFTDDETATVVGYFATAMARDGKMNDAADLALRAATLATAVHQSARQYVRWAAAANTDVSVIEGNLKAIIDAPGGDPFYAHFALAFDLYRDRMKKPGMAREAARRLIREAPSESSDMAGALNWLLSSAITDADFDSDANLVYEAAIRHAGFSTYRACLREWLKRNRGNKKLRNQVQTISRLAKSYATIPEVKHWGTVAAGGKKAAQARDGLLAGKLTDVISNRLLLAQAYDFRHRLKPREKSVDYYARLAARKPEDGAIGRAWVDAAYHYGDKEARGKAIRFALGQAPTHNDLNTWLQMLAGAEQLKDASLAKSVYRWMNTSQVHHGATQGRAGEIGERLARMELYDEAMAHWEKSVLLDLNTSEARKCVAHYLRQEKSRDRRATLLSRCLENVSANHGSFAAWLANEHFKVEDWDAFESTLLTSRSASDERDFFPWSMGIEPALSWVNAIRGNATMDAGTKQGLLSVIGSMNAGLGSASAKLALDEMAGDSVDVAIVDLKEEWQAVMWAVDHQGHWDHLMTYVRRFVSAKQHIRATTLLTTMLNKISRVDDKRRKTARDLASNLFTLMSGSDMDLDEENPLAPLLKISMLLQIGDDESATDQYLKHRKLFDERYRELPTGVLLFAAGTEIDTASETGLSRAEEMLRLWLVHNAESSQVTPKEKSAVQLLLARAYFESGRYDIARGEYTTVLNEYPEAEAAISARFGMAQCYVEQKVFDKAEEIFAELRDGQSPETTLRAEFLMGVMAVRQGEFDVGRELFQSVLERTPSAELANETLYNLAEVYGVEQRFLAQLNMLRTIGRLGQRSKRWHTPGHSLFIVVHDSDLGVSRGNLQIPVNVTTDPGGDMEQVMLASGSAGKGLFTAEIATLLDEPTVGDGVLQISGADEIHVDYPDNFKQEFNSELPQLDGIRIASDATFKAASRKIQEEKKETVTEQLIRDTEEQDMDLRKSVQRNANQIRPGNLIYMRVADYDRDFGNENDEIDVNLTASNGDSVSAKLTETAPHSGTFEGTVPTAEMPASAGASDMAIGHGPLMAIDHDPESYWMSEPDGAAGKWLSVDMKDIHPVDTVQFSFKATPEQAPKRVRLMGSHDGRFLYEMARHPLGQALNPIVFGGGMSIVQKQSEWMYHDLGRDLGQAWREPDYDDTAWPSGKGPLGYGDLGAIKPATTVGFGGDAGSKYPTTYFRKSFQFAPAEFGTPTGLAARVLSDDGFVLYLNGVEVARNNMPEGDAAFTTLAATTRSSNEEDVYKEFTLSLVGLRNGRNVLSVGVHQANGTSTDIGFDLELLVFSNKSIEGITQRVYRLKNVEPIENWNDAVKITASRSATETTVEESLEWSSDLQEIPQKQRSNLSNLVVWSGSFIQRRRGAVRFVVDADVGGVMVGGRPVAIVESDEGMAGEFSDIFLEAGIHSFSALAWVADPRKGVSCLRARENLARASVKPVSFRLSDFVLSGEEHEEFNAATTGAVQRKTTAAMEGDQLTFELGGWALRHLRLEVDEYSGDSVSVKNILVKSGEGTVIPPKEDVLELAKNSILEIAAGDSLTAVYIDELTEGGLQQNRQLEQTLEATYFNGTITPISYEFRRDSSGNVKAVEHELLRVEPGERIVAEVTDFDLDQTSEPDKVPVQLQVNLGLTMNLLAVETGTNTGVFRVEVETTALAESKESALILKRGDRVYLRYIDLQNTFPGHRHPRESVVFVNEPTEAKVRVLGTNLIEPADDTPNARPTHEYSLVPFASTNASPVSVGMPFTVEVIDPDRAKTSGSLLTVDLAVGDNRKVQLECVLSARFADEKPESYSEPITAGQALVEGRFVGQVLLVLGDDDSPHLLPVTPETPVGLIGEVSQTPRQEGEFAADVRVLNLMGGELVGATYRDEHRLSGPAANLVALGTLVSDATPLITDSQYEETVESLHVGERLFLIVEDSDRDISPKQDQVVVTVKTSSGEHETVTLTETLTHSGVFTGSFPLLARNSPSPNSGDDAVECFFGDTLEVFYLDQLSSSRQPVKRRAEVSMAIGTDGLLAAFSKFFEDVDLAAQTRFHIAESYFELFKSQKKLERLEQSQENLDNGRRVLLELAEDFPGEKYAARVSYLLGQFAQEQEDWAGAVKSYRDVIRRFPDHPLVPDAQYKMAQCHEEAGDFNKALEEYVAMAAIHPNSPLIPKVMIRINEYYYLKENYPVAARVSGKFIERFPEHELASRMAFRWGQCHYKQAAYSKAAERFEEFAKRYPDDKMCAEALFWAGESFRMGRDVPMAFRYYNRCRWDYPESEAAKYARGRLALPEMLAQFEREADLEDE